jgi:dihydropyrimidinase
MYDLLIRGATAVCPGYTAVVDVGVRSGTIDTIAAAGSLPREAGRVIDADGLHLLPGGIDAHVHITPAVAGSFRACYTATSIAAAHGGTTTFINFGDAQPDESYRAGMERWIATGSGASAVDFALHCIVSPMAWDEWARLGEVIDLGIPSFKAFMLNSKGRIALDEGMLLALFSEVGGEGGSAPSMPRAVP